MATCDLYNFEVKVCARSRNNGAQKSECRRIAWIGEPCGLLQQISSVAEQAFCKTKET